MEDAGEAAGFGAAGLGGGGADMDEAAGAAGREPQPPVCGGAAGPPVVVRLPNIPYSYLPSSFFSIEGLAV